MFITKKIKSSTGKINTMLENSPYQTMLEATSIMVNDIRNTSLDTFRATYQNKKAGNDNKVILEAYRQFIYNKISNWAPKMERCLDNGAKIHKERLAKVLESYKVERTNSIISNAKYASINLENATDKYFWSYSNLNKFLQQDVFMESYDNTEELNKLNYPPSNYLDTDFVKESMIRLNNISKEYDSYVINQKKMVNMILKEAALFRVSGRIDDIKAINSLAFDCSKFACKQNKINDAIVAFESYITDKVLEDYLDAMEAKLREV